MFRYNGHAYATGLGTSGALGYGGQAFLITWPDGQEQVTRDLWLLGERPEHSLPEVHLVAISRQEYDRRKAEEPQLPVLQPAPAKPRPALPVLSQTLYELAQAASRRKGA